MVTAIKGSDETEELQEVVFKHSAQQVGIQRIGCATVDL